MANNPKIITKRINSAFIARLNQFCDNNDDIDICASCLNAEVFKAEWFVGLFESGDAHNAVSRPALLNLEGFREVLQQTYKRARDWIKRFKFFGYFYIKDIEGWYEYIIRKDGRRSKASRRRAQRYQANRGDEKEYSSSKEDSEGEDDTDDEDNGDAYETDEQILKEKILLNLPFGIIETSDDGAESYGDFCQVQDRNAPLKRLIFQCNDPERAKLYEFVVVDKGARFMAANKHRIFGGGYGRREEMMDVLYAGTGCDMIPVSAFVGVYEAKVRLDEAELSLFDSNSQICYPEGFATSKPQADNKLDETSQRDLFVFETILGARQADNMEREAVIDEKARYETQKIQFERAVQRQQAGGSEGYHPRVTVAMQRKAAYGRPLLSDGLDTAPLTLQVPQLQAGAPIIPIEERQRRYETTVCSLMRVPYVFFKIHSMTHTHSSGSGGGSTRTGGSSASMENNEQFQRMLEEEVKYQQLLVNEILREIFSRTLARLYKGANNNNNSKMLYDPDSQKNIKKKKKAKNNDNGMDVEGIDEEEGLIGLKVAVKQGGKPLLLRAHFENVVVRSDAAVAQLLPYYEMGIIDAVVIRELLYKNLNIKRSPEKEPKNPYPKQIAATKNNNNSNNSNNNNEGAKKRKRSEEKEEESHHKEQKKEKKESSENSAGDKEEKKED